MATAKWPPPGGLRWGTKTWRKKGGIGYYPYAKTAKQQVLEKPRQTDVAPCEVATCTVALRSAHPTRPEVHGRESQQWASRLPQSREPRILLPIAIPSHSSSRISPCPAVRAETVARQSPGTIAISAPILLTIATQNQ